MRVLPEFAPHPSHLFLPGNWMTKIAVFQIVLNIGLADSSGSALADDQRRFNVENDIVPILSKFGCNSSGCHGKAEGQNGFKLSIFGFDPVADYAALTQEGRG